MIAEDRKQRYLNAKEKLLSDKSICVENRDLWTEFLAWQEHKLKRTNGLRELDDGTYRTLYYYLIRFQNMNLWFENKAWKDLTKEDIKRIYDDLEDGHIVNQHGQPFKSKEDYYSKIFKSKVFEMIGKAELAREVIEYSNAETNEVRFILEPEFRKLVENTSKRQHKGLLWLAFDIGENINALLQLKRSDCYRELNPSTREPEYRINLRKEILKRSRKTRSEITNYSETVELLDELLKDLAPDDIIFQFDYRNAKKIIDRAAMTSDVKVIPTGDKVTWKDLRSGMACDLLKKGWTRDEVNSRLGHKPSSDEIDRYINFLAINRYEPKKKVEQYKVRELKDSLDEVQDRERIQTKRLIETQELLEQQQKEIQQMRKQMELVLKQVLKKPA